MTRRVQGGTLGLLSAIDAGRVDELDARLLEDPIPARMTPTRIAEIKRRDAQRAHLRKKEQARRSPF